MADTQTCVEPTDADTINAADTGKFVMKEGDVYISFEKKAKETYEPNNVTAERVTAAGDDNLFKVTKEPGAAISRVAGGKPRKNRSGKKRRTSSAKKRRGASVKKGRKSRSYRHAKK